MATKLAVAVALHQSQDLDAAQSAYLAVLEEDANHPEANHNLGALLVQRGEAEQALPFCLAALENDSGCAQYWLTYIDALDRAGQRNDALAVLEMAKSQGLEGKQVEALACRMNPPREGRPEYGRIDEIVALFGQGRLTEAEQLAEEMTRDYPQHEFGWKALGAVYQQQGRIADALLPMKKAVELSPQDVESHYNLGVIYQALEQQDDAEAIYRRALQINAGYADAHCNLGVVLQNQGRLDEACASYRRAIELKPDYVSAHYNLGNAYKEQDKLEEAKACYLKTIALNPGLAEAHCNLGNVYKDMGDMSGAEACFLKTLDISPAYAAAHFNLGNLFKDMGRYEDALTSYARAIALDSDYAEAHYNLGYVKNLLGRVEEAEASCMRALQIKPELLDSHFKLGNALNELKRLDEAEAIYRWVLKIAPDHAEALGNLGVTLLAMQRMDEAEVCLRQALQIKPDYALAYCNLGAALNDLGRMEEAEVCLRQALSIKPDYADAHSNLGLVLYEFKRLREAEASFRQALRFNPGMAEAYCNLGLTLIELGRSEESEFCFKQAQEIRPDFPELHNNLGNLYIKLGQMDDALACFKEALKIRPGFALAHSNLIFALDLMIDEDTASLQAERRRWDEIHGAQHYPTMPYANVADPERKLRVGYLSGDFREHSAPKVFGGMLTCYDREHFEVFAYSNYKGRDDHIAELFKKNVTGWRYVAGMSDDAVAAKIREDGIDILVDISAHSAGNRLLVFARKPAPVQITGWGYASATGMRAMDAFFADPVVVPEHEREHFVEQVVDLPCVVGTFSVDTFPEVNALPALSEGCVTFGSFNRLTKVSEESYRLWCRLLHEVPGSRLLMKAPELTDPPVTRKILDKFVSAGIDPSRILMMGRTTWTDQMLAHYKIDLALDPFPHGGGVTTQESLMMGVPVVTLCWPTMAGRVSSSIMTSLGLSDWVADTMDEYVALAKAKVSDLSSLAALRAELPERYTSSVMGDPALYAVAVEREYRNLWKAWCKRIQKGEH